MWVAPLLLLVVGADTDKEAEMAFRQMDARIAKAQALDCGFDIKIEGKRTGSFKGTLVATEGNKARVEMSGEVGGEAHSMLVVSDGTKSVTVEDKKAQPAKDPPKDLSTRILSTMGRVGVFGMLIVAEARADGEKPAAFDVNERLKVSDFKLGKKEKVGDQEAQAIEYTLRITGTGDREPARCTVWVDTKTGLPVKRTLVGTEGNEKFTVTYTKFAVDGKIDPKTFELPK
jgi:outer membrane lipoprotein-sorting protein